MNPNFQLHPTKNFSLVFILTIGLFLGGSRAFGMYQGMSARAVPSVQVERLYQAAVVLRPVLKVGVHHDCMGILIRQNMVLTAGHCVEGALQVHVFLYNQERNLTQVESRNWIWKSKTVNFDGGQNFADIAVLLIPTTPEWNKPVEIAEKFDTVHEHGSEMLWLLSRSLTEYKSNSPKLTVVPLVDHFLYNDFPTRKEDLPLLEGSVIPQDGKTEMEVCQGDFGAPILGMFGQNVKIIGVNRTSVGTQVDRKFGDRSFKCGKIEAHYNISTQQKFIEQAIRQLQAIADKSKKAKTNSRPQ